MARIIKRMGKFADILVSDSQNGNERIVAVNLDDISFIDFNEDYIVLNNGVKFYIKDKESWDIVRTFFMQNKVSLVKELK